ncbi:hypothetical protein [Rothia sp. (in: high G+C Gram-positive bacteria)]|uniref:hypothetical protein n=1 Tax=Rothia sp. (in: high G+C Gram-positive bacteria) TaxID=1885016 RepID=UPI000EC85AAE|nr:hypothetical protein [Rothia sp. (in: high G+C Gram-positive bacteria)]
MPRSLPKIFAALLALILLALVAVGLTGQRKSEQTRAELETQSAIAAQLLSLQEAGEDGELGVAITASLETLAPAAREFEAVQVSDGSGRRVEQSLDALLSLGFDAQTTADRERALMAAVRVWQGAVADGLVEGNYPSALEQRLEGLEGFVCDNPNPAPVEGAVSEPVLHLQDALGQLGYVAEVYAARAGQEYGEVAETAGSWAKFAETLEGELSPILSCEGLLQAPAASYPLAEPADASTQLDATLAAITANAQAALGDSALPTEADRVELLLVKTLLDAGSAS